MSAAMRERGLPEDLGQLVDTNLSAGDLAATAAVSHAAKDYASTSGYKKRIADKREDERMAELGFADWKTNWLQLAGDDVQKQNMDAAKRGMEGLRESFVCVTLRGHNPETEYDVENKTRFRSNAGTLYRLFDPLVKEFKITRLHEHSSFPSHGQPYGGIVDVLIITPSSTTPEATSDETSDDMKRVVVHLMKKHGLSMDWSQVEVEPPSINSNYFKRLGSGDRSVRRFVDTGRM